MTALAMFPGQGSQRVGMSAIVLEAFPDIARDILDRVDRISGLPVSQCCATGTLDDLGRTEMTQPAIAAVSLIMWKGLQQNGFRPTAVAGHSLGEITALTAAGVMSIDTCLAIASRRGVLMAQTTEHGGGMVAVLDLPSERVHQLCTQDVGIVEVANYNSATQTIIAGTDDALLRVADRAGSEGATTKRLRVGAVCHCSLTSVVAGPFGEFLDGQSFERPTIPVISSVTGLALSDDVDVRGLLVQQLTRPVLWQTVLATACEVPIERFVEVGPGKVLSGLVRQNLPDAETSPTAQLRQVVSLIDHLDKAAAEVA